MVSAGLNLRGEVVINASQAMTAADGVSKRLEGMAASGRASGKAMREVSSASLTAARALKVQTDAAAKAATAQAAVNKVQKEAIANAKLIGEKQMAVRSAASDASGIAATKKQIMLGESMEKVTNNRAIAERRLNNETLRGEEIQGRTGNAARVAAGREALTTAKAQTEAVRQLMLAEQQEERAALNAARIKESAIRSNIAAQRLQMQQEIAASAASARAANQQRESLAVTRGALGSLGSSFTHTGVVTGALFIGMAANAIIMEREFANVVRTSDILDSGLTKVQQHRSIDKLRLQFDGLAQELPVTYKHLTEIGAAANQLGVSSNNLASFTKTVAQFSAVTGVTVDTASTAFGRLDSLIVNVARNGKMIGGVNHDYQGLADSINKVGVNSVATDQQIINIASQISGIANAAGLGYKEVIGFSGALASVNISPYLARGLTTRLFTDIGNAVSEGGTRLTQFATVSGETAQQFAADWKSNPTKAIENFFDGIRASGGDAVTVLKSLGLNSVLDQPAIIRLANAGDKFGKSADAASRSGGILRQTFNDASTAAGENARQYEVIAGTVQSKLTLALNRAQILIRNIGSSNLGPLGDAIDTVSSGALKLSQNLDKPFKLLGSIDLPFTNGQLIGLGVGILGVVSVLALLGGAAAKVGSGLIALKQAFIGVRTYLGGGGPFRSAATSATEATAAINGQTAAVERLAAAQKAQSGSALASAIPVGPVGARAVNYQTGLASSVGNITAQTSAFAASSSAAAKLRMNVDRALFSVKNMENSSSRVVRALAPIGTVGAAAFQRVEGAAKSVGTGIATAGKAVGSFFTGPLGIATLAIGGFAALNALNGAMLKIGTSAGDMAVGISQSTNALQILKGTKVSSAGDGISALFNQDTKSFLTSTKALKQSLDSIGKGGFFNDFAAKVGDMFLPSGSLNKGFNYTTAGLDKINDGFKQLADGGNVDGAVKGIQTLFKGMSDSQVTNALAHMGDATSILTEKLNANGKEAGKNNKNVLALAKGTLVLSKSQQAVSDEIDSVTQAYNGNTVAATAYLDATKKLGADATDLNAAFTEASQIKDGDPYANFVKTAKSRFQDFVDSQINALKIVKDTGADLATVSALDPGILSGAVKGGKKNEKQLADLLNLKDAQANFSGSVAKLGADPNGKILGAFTSLGHKGMEAVAKALEGGASIPDAFRAAGKAGIEAFNKTVGKDQQISLKLNTDDLNAQLANLSSKDAGKLSVKILGDAAPAIHAGESAAEIIAGIKTTIRMDGNNVLAIRKGETAAQQLNRLKSTLTIFGDAGPAIAKGTSTAEQIGMLQARIILDADTDRVHEKASDVVREIKATRAEMNISGNPIPVQKKGESAAEYISRLHAVLKIDATNGAAKLKGQQVQAQINHLKATLKILGNDAPAQAKGESTVAFINRLKGLIKVFADTSPAQKKAAAQQREISSLKSTIRVNGNTAPAQKSGESAAAYISRLRSKITITADASAALAIYNQFRSKTVPVFFKAANSIPSPLKQASGGAIRGAGTGTSDSIPAMLSNGEYVIRASQAKRFRSLLDNLNYRGVAAFATGGQVTGGSATYNGTIAARQSAAVAYSQQSAPIGQITELSPYDRHLLQTIADNIGVVIAPEYVAGAATNVNRGQARRGNG